MAADVSIAKGTHWVIRRSVDLARPSPNDAAYVGLPRPDRRWSAWTSGMLTHMSPYIALVSAVAGSGKSTLADLVARVDGVRFPLTSQVATDGRLAATRRAKHEDLHGGGILASTSVRRRAISLSRALLIPAVIRGPTERPLRTTNGSASTVTYRRWRGALRIV